MEQQLSQLFYVLEALVFLATFLLHLPKKNSTLTGMYVLQSIAVALLLLAFAFEEGSIGLGISALLTLAIKGLVAPLFFFRLISKHQFKLTGSTYLNTPLTLLVLLATTVLVYAAFGAQIELLSSFGKLTMTAISAIIMSLFLIVNRKGALSQIIGILSLENAIVTLALFIGLEHTFVLEFGIQFDILMWVVIASIFVTMVYKQFGTLEVTEMTHLTED